MGWIESFVRSPYPLVALAAVCFGAAIGCFVPLPRKVSARSRRRAVAGGMFLLSFSLVFLTLAFLLPGPDRFFDLVLLWFASAFAAIAFVATLFPVIIGVPMLLIYSVVLVLTAGYARTWIPAAESVNLARIRVVAATTGAITVEIAQAGIDDREVLLLPAFELNGDSLAVAVDLLEPHDAWLVLGIGTGLRLAGIRGYRYSTDEGAYILSETQRLEQSLTRVDERIDSILLANRLPGIESRQLTGTPRRVGVMTGYDARFEPPDTLVLSADN